MTTCTCNDRSWYGSYHDTQCPLREGETAGQMLQRLGIDGMKWAEEMHKQFPAIPVDDLLGWCCNMIMAGYDRRDAEVRGAMA